VVLVDALQTGESPAGTVRRLSLADLAAMAPTQHTASPHDASLPTALALGRRMGAALPGELVIVAVEVDNVMDFGDIPTPSVAAAIPEAVATVLGELDRWGVTTA
jgi:hydrogenase maturation protease